MRGGQLTSCLFVGLQVQLRAAALREMSGGFDVLGSAWDFVLFPSRMGVDQCNKKLFEVAD